MSDAIAKTGVTDAQITAASLLAQNDPETFAELIRAVRVEASRYRGSHADDVASLAPLLVAQVWDTSTTGNVRAVARAAVAFARRKVIEAYAATDALIEWDNTGDLTETFDDRPDTSTGARAWQGTAPDKITRTRLADLVASVVALPTGTDGDTFRAACEAYADHDASTCENCGRGRRPSLRGILAHGNETHASDRVILSRKIARALAQIDPDIRETLVTEGFDLRPEVRRRWHVTAGAHYLTADGTHRIKRGPASRAAWQHGTRSARPVRPVTAPTAREIRSLDRAAQRAATERDTARVRLALAYMAGDVADIATARAAHAACADRAALATGALATAQRAARAARRGPGTSRASRIVPPLPTTAVTDEARKARKAAGKARRAAYAATLPGTGTVETVRPVFVVNGRGVVTPTPYRALPGWTRADVTVTRGPAPAAPARPERLASHEGEGHDVIGTAPAPERDRRDDGTVRAFKAPTPRKRSAGGQTGPTVPARLSR